ncbi:MAG: acyl-ACP thioesterase domain-containing protein [Sphaerochaeta sp.]
MKYEYRRSFDISYSRSDRALELSLADAVSMTQDMNTYYFKSIGSDNLTVKNKNDALWVLTKTRLHFLKNAKWTETLEGRSVIIKNRGFRAELETVFKKGEESAFIAKQELCVIDASKRRIRSIDSISFPKDMEAEKESFPLDFFRLREEFGNENPVYGDFFRLTDIDFSRHVNNVAYVRYFANALGWDFFEENRIVDFEIHYRHESREGAAFEVFRKENRKENSNEQGSLKIIDMQMASEGNLVSQVRLLYEAKSTCTC